MFRRGRPVAVLALACAGITACSVAGGATGTGTGATGAPDARSASSASAPGASAAGRVGGAAPDPTADPTADPAATTPATGATTGGPLRGKVVVIDPGHNGANFLHAAQINRPVYIGNGTKACDTTGTETNAGFSEAAFTFDVSTRLAALLRAEGATVVLTRADNRGVGPCINERAAIGNRAHADAAISIHGDGAPASGHGFHVIVPHGIGSNDAIVTPSRRLGVQLRDAFHAGTGEALSSYTGTRTGGLVARSDLGGLNLSEVPKVFIECGNMRNAADARRMTSTTWRQQAAAALARGITAYLTSG